MNYLRLMHQFNVLIATLSLLSALQMNVEGQEIGNEREPVQLRNQRSYNLLFLQFAPETSDVLPKGKSRLSIQFDIANNLLIPNSGSGATVIEDFETQRLQFAWRKGLSNSNEIEIFLPVVWRNGGVLDGILNAYHKFINFKANQEDDPAGRKAGGEYHSSWKLIDSDGKVLVDQRAAVGFGDLELSLKHSFNSRRQRGATAIRFGVKLPTGNLRLLLGSGGADIGFSFDSRYRVGRDFTFYFNLGGVLTGRANAVPNRESALWQGFFGAEYHPSRRDSYFAQVDWNSPAVRTGNLFADRLSVTALFGYKREVTKNTILSVAFAENGDIHNYKIPALSSIGPDLTLSFGIAWKR